MNKVIDSAKVFFIALVFFSQNLLSQTIPFERLGNWEGVGVAEPNYQDFTFINVSDHGMEGDSNQIVSGIMKQLLEDAGNQPTLFYFPTGTYVFNEPIEMTSNKIFKGDSIDISELRFVDFANDDLIRVNGKRLIDTFLIENQPQKGAFRVKLDRNHDFEPGDFVYLFQDDEDKIGSDWAFYSTGHLATVRSVNGQVVFLETPINQNFEAARNPKLYEIEPIENVFFQCLKIKATEPSTGQKSNIQFRYARNCGVSGVESINCEFAHVRIRQSTEVTVFGSYFQDGFTYGNGGKAYGVAVEFGSTRCLIENNIFNHLRHSILFQSGSNNNVAGYNYSKNPYWRGVSLPFDAAGELVFHGNYTFSNLLEGNIVQNMVSDDSHSFNGPFNTFFRNRTEGYGFTNGFAPPSDSQNLVGNVIVQSPNPFIPALFVTPGEGHLLHGNFYQGAIRPTDTNEIPEASLYLTQTPDFLAEMPNWTPIGSPNGLGNEFNPAKLRSEIYDVKTYCRWQGFPPDTTTSVENIDSNFPKIFPNPSSDGLIFIKTKSGNTFDLKMFSSLGKLVFDQSNLESGASVDAAFLPKGIYFLRFRENGSEYVLKWIRD